MWHFLNVLKFCLWEVNPASMSSGASLGCIPSYLSGQAQNTKPPMAMIPFSLLLVAFKCWLTTMTREVNERVHCVTPWLSGCPLVGVLFPDGCPGCSISAAGSSLETQGWVFLPRLSCSLPGLLSRWAFMGSLWVDVLHWHKEISLYCLFSNNTKKPKLIK